MLNFFLLNYLSHVATVVTVPGETTISSLRVKICALLLPFSGVMRGLRAISLAKRPGESDLEHAARAGALCIVVSHGGHAKNGTQVQHPQAITCPSTSTSSPSGTNTTSTVPCLQKKIDPERTLKADNTVIDPDQGDGPTAKRTSSSTKVKSSTVSKAVQSASAFYHPLDVRWNYEVHGRCVLREGFYLAPLPSNVQVDTEPGQDIKISSSRNVVAALVGIIQVVSAIIALYSARDTQLNQYGYAAFSLTVIQYGIMSLINLIGALATPEYQKLHIIRSNLLEKAIDKGGVDGTVGCIVQNETPTAITGRRKCFFELRWPRAKNRKSSRISFESWVNGMLPLTAERTEKFLSRLGHFVIREETSWERTFRFVAMGFLIGALVIPYILIAILTKFQPEQSTASQRGWTISWLVAGQVLGFVLSPFHESMKLFDMYYPDSENPEISNEIRLLSEMKRETVVKWIWMNFIINMLMAGIPGIGGFVTVGLMMKDYGKFCVAI